LSQGRDEINKNLRRAADRLAAGDQQRRDRQLRVQDPDRKSQLGEKRGGARLACGREDDGGALWKDWRSDVFKTKKRLPALVEVSEIILREGPHLYDGGRQTSEVGSIEAKEGKFDVNRGGREHPTNQNSSTSQLKKNGIKRGERRKQSWGVIPTRGGSQ